MRRHDYLRLRTEQIDAYPNVSSWDTAPLPRLQALEDRLLRRLAVETNELVATAVVRRSDKTEVWVSSRNTRRQLLYLRALRYLREHGIAPEWPLQHALQQHETRPSIVP
jgi:hypothetical protein